MNDSELVKKKSKLSVQETMDKLESTIKEREITIFSKIDHYDNAKKVGLEMEESQVIIFGNPKAGTMLMKDNIFLSLDLPIKVAVVKDKSGDVWIVYNRIDSLKEKYDLADSEILEKLDKLLDTITEQAIE